MNEILKLIDITTKFNIGDKELIAVNNVSLKLNEDEMIGIVGESGCGKSMTANSIIGLIPHPGKITNGKILFKGKDLLKIDEKEYREIRGSNISTVSQDPISSLNPSFNIFWHFNEVIKAHRKDIGRKILLEMIIELLGKVGIPDASKKIFQYPHQFSGGMRQRVVIAMALILKPSVVIADEPTTALDVTTQEEIFNLIEKLKNELGISFIIISHDLNLISERCNRTYVMYSGEIVESGNSEDIFNNPKHPYTQGLLNAIPALSPDIEKLETIDGEVQDLMNLPKDCYFASRCKFVEDCCKKGKPDLYMTEQGRFVKCFRYKN